MDSSSGWSKCFSHSSSKYNDIKKLLKEAPCPLAALSNCSSSANWRSKDPSLFLVAFTRYEMILKEGDCQNITPNCYSQRF